MAGPLLPGALLALASALLFGVATPAIARVGAGVGPLATAALLYAGAAAAALVLRLLGRPSGRRLGRAQLPRLVAIALLGAALAPALLAWGIPRTGATAASLTLNLEAAATALLAWLVHREPIGRRVALAIAAMVGGGALVALDAARGGTGAGLLGVVAVAGATVAWAADNTLTRALADDDPLEVVAAKGTLGAATTTLLAWLLREPLPSLQAALLLALVGATGYGLSLRLYLLAQRRIGAARTASLFAVGPFVGAALGWALGAAHAGWATLVGALAFGAGIWLHLSEHHAHRHLHPAVEHEHPHRHDDGHHTHTHDPPVTGEHTHPHRHDAVEHSHEHAPDLHHTHAHEH